MSKTTKRKANFTQSQPKKVKNKVEEKTSNISDEDLQFLKQFDLDMTFGPCTGITRRERYERAIRHELDPPVRVLELIERFPNDREVTHNLWRDYSL